MHPYFAASSALLRPRVVNHTNLTVTGASQTLVTGVAGKQIVVTLVLYSNSAVGQCLKVALKFSSSSVEYFPISVSGFGITAAINLIGNEIIGPPGDDLLVIMDTSNSPSLFVSANYILT